MNKGVNIIGFARNDLGLAEACRSVALTSESAHIPTCVINDKTSKHPATNSCIDHLLKNRPEFNTNIFANNIDVSSEAKEKLKIFDGYNICYAFWEFPKIPKSLILASGHFNEIWAPTKFVQQIFSKNFRTPIIYMPHAIDFKIKGNYNREYFNLPKDKFIFIFSFDLFSYGRKNSCAVIEAFKKAFDKDRADILLIIKTNGFEVDSCKERLAELMQKLDLPGHQIHNINSNLNRDEMYGLLKVCNCYISLHRTEGLGLGMAEAMKLGKPVIATGYSGNTDFMNNDNSFLVNYSMVKASIDQHGFLEKDSTWAEADIDHAAILMEHVVNNEADRNLKAKAGKTYIDENHSYKKIGSLYRQRLESLGLI